VHIGRARLTPVHVCVVYDSCAQVGLSRQLMYLIHLHWSQLGNGSVMNWRIFIESAWIGAPLAAWVGKWYGFQFLARNTECYLRSS
jgi:hypothetical protein